MVLMTTAAKVARWRVLLPPPHRPHLFPLTRALLIGQLGNALLPARAGDLARAHVAGSQAGESRALQLGSIAAEKAFDVLFLLICCGLAALTAPLPSWLTASLGGIAVLGLALFLVALALPERRFSRWLEKQGEAEPTHLTRMVRVLQRAAAGLASLRQPTLAAAACAWSAVVWALAAGTNYLLFRAFDLQLPFGAALLLLAVLHIGVAPPSSPGKLGVFHALAVFGLSTFGVTGSVSLAYAAVLHAIVYLPQILLGGAFLIPNRRGLLKTRS